MTINEEVEGEKKEEQTNKQNNKQTKTKQIAGIKLYLTWARSVYTQLQTILR